MPSPKEIDRGERLIQGERLHITELVWPDGGRSFEVHLLRAGTCTDLTQDGCYDHMPSDEELAAALGFSEAFAAFSQAPEPASLAERLDALVQELAQAIPTDRRLLSACRRCRNTLLYLLSPAVDAGMFRRHVRARLAGMAEAHRAHGAEGPDDRVPHIAPGPGTGGQ